MCNTYNSINTLQNNYAHNYGCPFATILVLLFGNGCQHQTQRVCRDCNGNLRIINGNGYGRCATAYNTTTATTDTAYTGFGGCGNTATTDTNTTANGYGCGYWRVRTCGCYGYSI